MDAPVFSASRRSRIPLALAAAVILLSSLRAGVGIAATADDHSVVVVVSADSPVTEMPRLHLADLYLGRTTRFPDGESARPIDQEAGSPSRTAFYDTYLGRSQAEIKAHWSKIIFTGRGRPPKAVANDEEVKELVAGDPSAVGYVERRLVDDSVRVVEVE
jgi:ABC-type phosphate transport system substrate-binding protein